MRRKPRRKPCRHCRQIVAIYSRQICRKCYRDPDVLAKYPTDYHRVKQEEGLHEPTMAEVEAMIAEQMKPENLPSWWFHDWEKPDRETGRENVRHNRRKER